MPNQFIRKLLSLLSTFSQEWGGSLPLEGYDSGRRNLASLLTLDQRHIDRVSLCEPCSYIVNEFLCNGSVVIHEGEGVVVNVGAGGMLLTMAVAPEPRHVLEVRMASLPVGPTVTLLEVCWTQKVLDEADAKRFLVGGKLLFGPYSLSKGRVLEEKGSEPQFCSSSGSNGAVSMTVPT